MAEVAGDAQDLYGSSGGDAKTNRDGAFDVELDGLGSVLGARLEENFGRGLGDGAAGPAGLGMGGGVVLAEIDGTSDASCGVERTGAARDAELERHGPRWRWRPCSGWWASRSRG